VPETANASYRALLAVPFVGRVLLSMQLALVGKQMAAVALVLFTLAAYGSAELAGLVAFLAMFPGLVLGPVAGALLDRHGRARLVVLDLVVQPAALVLIGGLSLLHLLPLWLLLLLVGLGSLTGPLSDVGLRSLLPLLVPGQLRGRLNALDSNLGAAASLLGPALAGAAVQGLGPAQALIAGGGIVGLGALVLRPAPDPPTEVASSGRLWRDTWQGLVYVWQNRTLRGLAATYAPISFVFGVLAIALPVLVLRRLEQGPAVVGALFALQGGAGLLGATLGGRIVGGRRERVLLAVPALAIGLGMALLAVAPSLAAVAVGMVAIGAMQSLMVVVLFTLRQRRAEPAWWGSGNDCCIFGPFR